ncbi:MAG: N-6 DNA methylase [Candidatus Melainabacteria bacterium]|nr:N-6 DNA methylase [Candidatus Melainabacteria bacterium]
MAKAQILLTELNEEWPSKSLSELNLAFLRKIAKKLTPSNRNLTDIGQVLAVKIIGHLNLAQRNLLPRQFNKSELSSALFKYFRASYFGEDEHSGQEPELRIKGSQIDDTAFAETLTSPLIINASDWPGTTDELIKWVSTKFAQSRVKESTLGRTDNGEAKIKSVCLTQIKAIAENTLSCGWVQELFGQSTQVFTPENIAQHLAAEVFESSPTAPSRLLDPACGAGHLLIPAAEHWLSLAPIADHESAPREESAQQLNTSKREQLHKLLSEVVTGLDVDHKLLQLCGFAFYLLTRDQLSELCELPLPRLFLSKLPAGSLTLGITRSSNQSNLQNADNAESFRQSEEWFDLQGKTAPQMREVAYNRIVMNPPYLSARIMGDTTANFLKRYYPDSAGDLYTAFIELATRLLAPHGKLSMIVQQSFLSVQRYRSFRLRLLEDCHITSCLTLGLGSFSARPGEKVNSAILTLERKRDGNSTSSNSDSSAKSLFNSTIDRTLDRTFDSTLDFSFKSNSHSKPRSIRVGRIENKNLSTSQIEEETALETMAAISGNPFAFDCPTVLANCFKVLPALSEIEGIAIVNGLFTCNNEKFVKLASRLPEEEKNLYVPYDKGGGQKWYHQTSYRLFWPDNGNSIRQYRKERGQSRALPGEEYYFKPGLTYSYIGTTGFKARLLSENSIFDIASSAIFSNKIDHHYLLGFLNSSLTIYLLGVLNPTINFQIGDLRRLPFSAPSAEISTRVSELAKDAIALMRHWHENQLTIPAAELIEHERKIQEEIDTIVCQLYKIDKATETIIRDNEWVVGSRKKLLK